MQLRRLKVSTAAFFTIMVVGILGFMVFENLSLLDAVYMTVVTMATVGFGDIVPVTSAGKVFTILLIITGFSTAYYTLTLAVSMTVEGHLKNAFGRRGMQRRIAILENHIIVCGAGKVGSNVVHRLMHEAESFVVIEKDAVLCQRLTDQKVLVINGDATLDEIMQEAGVTKARGIITALSHDADNVYVTLSAKSLNPAISVVARADRPEAEDKLRRAGADTVIFPSVMGGRQMVSAMTKPVIMDFVESVFYNQELHMDIAEITIAACSPLVGKSFAESDIKQKFDSIVVAIKRGDQLITNPKASEVMVNGDIMIVLGQRGPLNEINKLASGVLAK